MELNKKKRKKRRSLVSRNKIIRNSPTKWHRYDRDSSNCTWKMKTNKDGERRAKTSCLRQLMWTMKFTLLRRRRSSKWQGQKSPFLLEWTFGKPPTKLHIVRKKKPSSATYPPPTRQEEKLSRTKKMNTRNYFVFNLTKIPYLKAAAATVATVMKVDLIWASEKPPKRHLAALMLRMKQQKARPKMNQE